MEIYIKAPIKEELEAGDFLYVGNETYLLVLDNVSNEYLWINLSTNLAYHSRFKTTNEAMKLFSKTPYRIIKANSMCLQEVD